MYIGVNGEFINILTCSTTAGVPQIVKSCSYIFHNAQLNGMLPISTPIKNDGRKEPSKEQTEYYDIVNETCVESQSKRLSITPAVLFFIKCLNSGTHLSLTHLL